MKYTVHLITLFLFFQLNLSGQIAVCEANIQVSLSADGTAFIFAETFDDGSSGFVELSVDRNTFTCDDIGAPIVVTLTATAADGNTDQCQTVVEVVDKLPPVVICMPDFTVSLPDDGVLTFTVDDFEQNSFDNCEIVSRTISQSTFNCGDIGENFVHLTVTDLGGFEASCQTRVTILNNVNCSFDANCHSNFVVNLDNNGEAYISVDDINDGSSGYTGLTIDRDLFTCDDLGENVVTLVATDADGGMDQCETVVLVRDILPPIAVCESSIDLELGSDGTATLSPQDLDDGSWDNCGSVTFGLSQSEFDCSHAGEANVILTVTDLSGNENFCWVVVNIEDNINATNDLACRANLEVGVTMNNPVVVTSDLILDGGPYHCPAYYNITLTNEATNEVVPDDLLTIDHIGMTFMVVVEDPSTGNSCWGTITVVDDDPCQGTSSFDICDTQCWTAAVSDCATGHDLDDDVEWPCDIQVSACDLGDYPSSEVLLSTDLVNDNDAAPRLFDTLEAYVDVAYEDEVFTRIPDFDGVKILRRWVVIDWCQFDGVTRDPDDPSRYLGYWEYTQVILLSDGLDICDTLPWNTPIGDCDSGHTDQDGVEWPADISIQTCNISPESLSNNPDVHPNDVRPEVSEDCYAWDMGYADLVLSNVDDVLTIERTWTVASFITDRTATYNQILEIDVSDCMGQACAFTPIGRPVSDVVMSDGFVTDTTGCVIITDLSINRITPTKEDDLDNGVDILDAIYLTEYLLGERVLSAAQLIAADLTFDGGITTLDLLAMQQIVSGLDMDIPSWKFFDADLFPTEREFADLSSANEFGIEFLAIKMGDINYSAVTNFTSTPPNTFVTLKAEDDIFNLGESYTLDVRADSDQLITGLQMEIQLDQNRLDLMSMSSLVLEGFDSGSYSVSDDGVLSMFWVPDMENLRRGGVAVEAGDILISLDFAAVNNGIFSDALTLSNPSKNVMAQYDALVTNGIILDWENRLTTDVFEANGRKFEVRVGPNPAQTYLNIRILNSDQSLNKIKLYNQFGQLVKEDALVDDIQLDVGHLQAGYYILQLENEQGGQFIDRIVIMN